MAVGNTLLPDPDGYELSRLRRRSGEGERTDDNDKLEDLDEQDPLHQAEEDHERSADFDIEPFQVYTPDEETQILRKLDFRVTAFMSWLYLLSFLDRSNIGNAKVAGMNSDLGLSDGQFAWLLTAFYITYISFEWMILLYHFLKPHVYISLTVLSWGLLASLQALSTNFSSLLILRALLGVSEAAFSPGVPFYLSFFYRRDELALRAGIQVSAAPLAASFAGSLAYLITWLGQNGPLASWRLLFLVEGFPSVLVALMAFYYVPDSASSAWFLTPRERRIASMRLEHPEKQRKNSNAWGATKALHSGGKFDFREIVSTIKDPKCYITALMFLCCNIAFSSMPVFLPTILNEMGYSPISSQAMSAPPYLFAFFVVLVTAQASDKAKSRSPFVCFHALMAFFGYALNAIGGQRGWPDRLRYICVYPAAAGFFSAVTIIITWTMNNQESNAKKGMGMTILNIIGQCGPLIGTRLYPDSDKPLYVRGMSICALAMLVVFFLSLLLRLILIRENRSRARANASLPGQKGEHFVLML